MDYKEEILCQNCGCLGHDRDNCLMCQSCGRREHKTLDCQMCQKCGSREHKEQHCPFCQRCRKNHTGEDCIYCHNCGSYGHLPNTDGMCLYCNDNSPGWNDNSPSWNDAAPGWYENETGEWKEPVNYLCPTCKVYGHTREECTWCRRCQTFGHGYSWHKSCPYCRKCRRFGHNETNCCWDWGERNAFSLDIIPIKTRKDVIKNIDVNVDIPDVLLQLIAEFTYDKKSSNQPLQRRRQRP